jgi:hypothetical protein
LTIADPTHDPAIAGADDTKIIVVVNKRLSPGQATNASAHAVAGLVATTDAPVASFSIIDYRTQDADGFTASQLPLIVLRAGAGHLARLRRDLLDVGVAVSAFHADMTGGTWDEQLARSAAKPADAIELYAVASIGSRALIDPLTKRCSLL